MMSTNSRSRNSLVYVGEYCYKLADLLGCGYSSKVYRGKKLNVGGTITHYLGEEVAIKVINMANVTE